ncbi:hypothetical protein [Weissella confusa]|uniref:hypothetical protein n=1 Tax=Weissella confusa TaxID=1583 RepID=UPI00107FD67A|nr:hypothetical protein [Weissella confusa]MBJ7628167.1 hypothetical protein [Weissella confusa]TGE48877.1 hypothetical protein C6P23_03670 [Weissella confusa]
MTEIKLDFSDKTLTGLAGYEYGMEVYEKQIKSKISEFDIEHGFTIVFPDTIENIASSFVQGFFENLIGKVGYENIQKIVKINSSSKKLTEGIWQDME